MNSLLIDFDGVVFNNKRVAERIKEKSIHYIASRKKTSYSEAAQLNKQGYSKLGHTSRILSDNHVHDYNSFVFDRDLFRYIYNEIDEKDILLIQQLIDIKNKRNIDLVLCTNAPYDYCQHTLNCGGFLMDNLFSSSMTFTSDSGLCKPLQSYYETIEHTYKPNHDSHYYFVDDSVVNILPCIKKRGWNACVINKESDLFYYLNHF